jgi:hypothetical protein
MGFSFPGTNFGAITASALSPPTVGSISFWIRPASLGGTQRICATGDAFEGRFDGTTLFNDFAKSGSNSLNFGTFSNGTLYHLVATWSLSTAVGQCYRDGAFFSSDSTRNTVSNGTFSLSGRPGTGNFFAGQMYDVRIYNRIILPAEIVTIFNSEGNDSIVNGLQNRWRMDEGSAGTVFSGAGASKDIGPSRLDLSSSTAPPTYVYDAAIGGRRRLT